MIAVTMGRVLFLICYLSDLMKGTELGNRVFFLMVKASVSARFEWPESTVSVHRPRSLCEFRNIIAACCEVAEPHT